MRTDHLAKIALTVLAVSLIGNVLQFAHARVLAKAHDNQAQAHQLELTRLHIEYRKDAMRERATAFNALVLGSNLPAHFSDSVATEGNYYKTEYAVRIPQEKEKEFIDWMAAAEPEPFTIFGRETSHEAAYRVVQENGREVGELYEKYSVTQ
jgi:hypothetical protein